MMEKKQKEKLITILGISVLVIGLLAALVVLIVNNVGDTVITVKSKEAFVGDTVTLPITIDKNHGLYVGQMILKYDAEALEFVSAGNGNVFFQGGVNGTDIEEGTVAFIFNENSLENTKIDGVLANVTFRVKENAKKGEYAIKLLQTEKVEEGTYFLRVQDIDEEKWTVPKCVDGKIIVK